MTYNARNEGVLRYLDPVAAHVFRYFLYKLSRAGEDVLVTDGMRTRAQQSELYARGRTKPGAIVTNAQYPYSYHNHGVAIDLVPVLFGQTTIVYNATARYERIAEIAKKVGIGWGFAEWGFDRPHFHYRQGHDLAYFIRGGRLDDSILRLIREGYSRELLNMLRVLERMKPGARRRKLLSEIEYVRELMQTLPLPAPSKPE